MHNNFASLQKTQSIIIDLTLQILIFYYFLASFYLNKSFNSILNFLEVVICYLTESEFDFGSKKFQKGNLIKAPLWNKVVIT